MRVILLFIDGVGVGPNDPAINPCCYSNHILNPILQSLPKNGLKFALDACLNVPGKPQSATGQTSIYTGKNAAKIIGRHLFGFPNQPLCQLLSEYSLFVELKNKNLQCQFFNAFRPVFFTSPELFKAMRLSTTTEMNRAAKYSFSSLKDIKNEMALYHDFTTEELRSKGFDLPCFEAKKAAKIIVKESKNYDLLLYEYFLTDMAGHAQNMDRAKNEIIKIEHLITAILDYINLDTTTLVVVSDHGNIEDLSVKSHTLNPAFMALWIKNVRDISLQFHSILDIYPFILDTIIGNKS
jgi:2,3-bisphosphoglycerate-independent phosphoglycerate mutase